MRTDKHKHGVARDPSDLTDVGICLDKSLRLSDPTLKCNGGIICETARTPQPAYSVSQAGVVSMRARGAVTASGDGTVPYTSMQHSLSWNGPGRLSQTVELQGGWVGLCCCVQAVGLQGL